MLSWIGCITLAGLVAADNWVTHIMTNTEKTTIPARTARVSRTPHGWKYLKHSTLAWLIIILWFWHVKPLKLLILRTVYLGGTVARGLGCCSRFSSRLLRPHFNEGGIVEARVLWKEHQMVEISRALHYGVPHTHIVVSACKTSDIKNGDLYGIHIVNLLRFRLCYELIQAQWNPNLPLTTYNRRLHM